MKLYSLLLGILTATIISFAQDTNAPEQKTVGTAPISYERRVEHGFGQLKEPRWAGDRPEWMRNQRGESDVKRGFRGEGKRGPMMGQNRGEGPRGKAMRRGNGPREFRGAGQCPLCEKHKNMVSRNHFEKNPPPVERGEPDGKSPEGPRHR